MFISRPDVEVLHHQGTSDAPSGWVEWCKARGLARYFWNNFKDQHSKPFLLLVNGGILFIYALKAAKLEIARRLAARPRTVLTHLICLYIRDMLVWRFG